MPQNRKNRRHSPPQSALLSSKIAKGREPPTNYLVRHLNQRQSLRIHKRQTPQPTRVYRYLPQKRETHIQTCRFGSSESSESYRHSARLKCPKKPMQPTPSGLYRTVDSSQIRIKFANSNDARKLRMTRMPHLGNSANSGNQKGHRTINTYHQGTQSPTSDLQTLVLVLVREQLHKEVTHLDEVTNEINPFEMANMRLQSFIANTPDIMDHWKSAMLGEGMRIIDESLESNQTSWVTPGTNQQLPMMVDEQTLISMPPDKTEISKSQVASDYIQAQRGQQISEQEESAQLFQSEMLNSKTASTVPQEMFDRIVNCHKHVVQKVVEIDFIEKKPETVQAVSNYKSQLKISDDLIVQEAMTQDLVDAVEQGRMFVKVVVGHIMDELHAFHSNRNFEPMRILVLKPE